MVVYFLRLQFSFRQSLRKKTQIEKNYEMKYLHHSSIYIFSYGQLWSVFWAKN